MEKNLFFIFSFFFPSCSFIFGFFFGVFHLIHSLCLKLTSSNWRNNISTYGDHRRKWMRKRKKGENSNSKKIYVDIQWKNLIIFSHFNNSNSHLLNPFFFILHSRSSPYPLLLSSLRATTKLFSNLFYFSEKEKGKGDGEISGKNEK